MSSCYEASVASPTPLEHADLHVDGNFHFEAVHLIWKHFTTWTFI